MKAAQVRPRQASQKYSKDENLSAKSASTGAVKVSTSAPNKPPITALTRPIPSTSSAWPLRVMAKASSVYAAEAGVPGMRSSAPGRSPAKIAMAVAVTIAASAGTGSMKKVTGTSSAVAMVAERPGIAPMNRPNAPESEDHQQNVGIEDQAKCLKHHIHGRNPHQA